MRGMEEEEEEELQVWTTWDCGSPLYDSFEVASLHYVLEKHTMVLPFHDDDAGAVAVSVSRSSRSSRRLELRRPRHQGGAAVPVPVPVPDMTKTKAIRSACAGAATRKQRKVDRRRRGWIRGGTKAAAAAVFRAVTCWRRL